MVATVELANGFKFHGSLCRDQNEAVESAASFALFQLVRKNLLSVIFPADKIITRLFGMKMKFV